MNSLVKHSQDLLSELAYLELDQFPDLTNNPFNDLNFAKFSEHPEEEIVKICLDKDYLHFPLKYILNVEPLPYQLVILDTLWKRKLPLLIASRGAAKSFILAYFSLLKLALEPGCRIAIVGAGFRQARLVFDYMANIWRTAPVLRDIAGKGNSQGPKREVDRFSFRIGDSIAYALPLGDGEKIRGIRANYIISDETGSTPEEIFNTVVMGFGAVSQNPVDKVKEFYRIKKMKEQGLWTPEMQEDHLKHAGGNQIIRSGTATFQFNHFYKLLKQWKTIIKSKGDENYIRQHLSEDFRIEDGFDWRDYAIVRLPYTHVAGGLLDPTVIAQARLTLTKNQWLTEYCAVFPSDSDGFFKRSVIDAATTTKPIVLETKEKIYFSAAKRGDFNKKYVLSVDPAANQDNAAIVIQENNPSHRKVVYCWTVNKEKHRKILKGGFKTDGGVEGDYYRYIARKIRSLMRDFPIEAIVMDSNGGGISIAEALGSKDLCIDGEKPIYPVIEEGNEQYTDTLDGAHIIYLITPSTTFNAEANHGMLKDLETKTLLFPAFDTVEVAKASEMDKMDGIDYDDYIKMEMEIGGQFETYEDLVNEIEDLKKELETIVVTQNPNGTEKWDTPEIKLPGAKKGRLRKDRYSALLYGNWWARTQNKIGRPMKYEFVGRVASDAPYKKKSNESKQMYYGKGIARISNIASGRMYKKR